LTDFQNRAANAPDSSGRIAATNYGADADTTLCHRFFWTVKRTPALLFETDAGSDTPVLLAMRTMAAYRFLSWTLSDASKPHACWTVFAKAFPSSQETLFPRAENPSHGTVPFVQRKPRIAWQVWGALICTGVGVFWRYGLATWSGLLLRRKQHLPRRAKPARKERLRAARINAQRRAYTPHDHHRPYFRFAQPDQRSRDARRPDLGSRDPARSLYQQVH
jgi:hypothetical protein